MVSNSFVLRFLFFVLWIFVQETFALKKGDVGTCVGKVSTVVNRRVTYWATGRCRNSKNICRARRWKNVPAMKWTTGTICCEGWQHDGEQDACKPICSLGCLDGQCVAPETCHCDPPLYLDPVRNYICKTPPVCNPPCINARCINKPTESTSKEQEDTPKCECLNTTRRYNKTHCAYCQEDYKINEDLTCSPICDPPCLNGECVATNQCKCFDGYEFKNGTCEPVCDGCVNGECVEPNTCKCLEGFSPLNRTHCVLKCECKNGECISGQCVCHNGYELRGGVCEPICGTCVNGLCVAPGVCTCYEEYNKSEAPGVCCRPECGDHCDENGECPNKACVLRIKYTIPGCTPTRKNRCIKFVPHATMGCCNHWKYDAAEDRCVPICRTGCINGTCMAPDTCQCLDGYAAHNETACTPSCDTPCNNGVCTAPNHCTCHPNYQLDPTDNFSCLPICEPQCVNAFCQAPNTCACNGGYVPENRWQCKPVCNSCQNGQCIAPNDCRCNNGYSMRNGQCEPVCDQPCLNGHCSAPNVCSCQTNYTLNNVNKFVCDPICEPACVNGKCVSPNKCSCDVGYLVASEWKCEPSCDSCENGKCIAPNECSCNDGYVKKNGTCAPVCDQPCLNGYCSRPNECSCHDRFELNLYNNFVCDPICEPKCENARCVSPNVCFCDSGYKADSTSLWKCKPMCDSCDNGVCVAPNNCSCNEGYALEDGRCVPVCESPCRNGRCIAPNKCECTKGYILNSATSQCDPICHPGCVNSKCTAPNKCECFDGYMESEKWFTCQPVCAYCEHGTCVAPNSCSCLNGYSSTNGSCSPVCINSCQNGHCTAPDICTCLEGYEKREGGGNVCYKTCESPCDNGFCNEYGVCECNPGFEILNNTSCLPVEPVNCDSCDGNCTSENYCLCNDGRPCYLSLPSSEEITTSPSLAGLEWSWVLGGALGLLLITLMLVVIQRTWARRQRLEKNMEKQNGVGSVVYHTVVPDTLITGRVPEDEENQADYYSDSREPHVDAEDSLLGTRVDVEDEHL